MVANAVRLVIALSLLLALTGCATVSPNLSPRGVREALAIEARADSVRRAGGPAPRQTGLGAGATSPAPLTLTWTNPTRLTARDPFRPAGEHRLPCEASTLAADTLLDLDKVLVLAARRVLCSPWALGSPEWPGCWHPVTDTLAVVLARGREGKRETVSIVPPVGVSVLAVVPVDDDGNAGCASNPVQVER